MLKDIGGLHRGTSRFFALGLLPLEALALLLCAAFPVRMQAQRAPTLAAFSSSSLPTGSKDAALPEAPAPVAAFPSGGQRPTQYDPLPARTHETSHFDALIDPTEIAPKLSAFDKVILGMRRAVSPYAMVGWVGVSTYEQAFDRSPNYGQTAKGYAQRLGAAAARDSSEGIFTNSLYSPLFRTDPRYYILGPGHGFAHRAGHALSRVLVTKTDGGRDMVNCALLAGNLTGAAVTQTYYPPGNRNLGQVMTTFGSSLAGSAFGYLFDEFIVNSAEFLQLKHRVM